MQDTYQSRGPSAAGQAGAGQKIVSVVRKGNLLVVGDPDGGPCPPAVVEQVRPRLTYVHREFRTPGERRAIERRDGHTGRVAPFEFETRRLFGFDHALRVYCSVGLRDQLAAAIAAAGYARDDRDSRVLAKDHRRPRRFEPDWAAVRRKFQFRPKQEECLAAISRADSGIVHAVTGFGKMVMIAMHCVLYPHARIHVVCRRVPVVNKLVEFLTNYVPYVGQFGAGARSKGERVTVFTAKSLHHSDFDADFLLGDECFVGSTPVLTPNGPQRIDLVRPGDLVQNGVGLGRVESVFSKPAAELYRVEFDDQTEFECTGDHPVFTDRGWTKVVELVAGDVAYGPEAVCALWQGNAAVAPRNRHPRPKADRSVAAELGETKDLLAILREEAQQPDEQGVGSPEGQRADAGAALQADQAWRERAVAAFAAVGVAPRPGGGVGSGGGGSHRDAQGERPPDQLQAGHRQPGVEDRDRGRRRQPLGADATTAGRPQGRVPGQSRVVRVSRVQRQGPVAVFNLRVSDHPSYFAAGKLVHNCHELGAKEVSREIALYQDARCFGYTATPVGRGDNADLRVTSLFGPVVFYIPYPEAVALGLVVQNRVVWHDVALSSNPAAGLADVARMRAGVWFNHGRNDTIARTCLAEPPDEQKLVLVDTLYHAVELYRRLKGHGYTLVYDSMDQHRFDGYKALGVLDDEPKMTPKLKEHYRHELEAGRGHYIATGTWAVGIDPVNLQHLYAASPWTNEIMVQQGAGRVSRKAEYKDRGVVHDYRDQWDRKFHQDHRTRWKIYESLGWEQVLEPSTDPFRSPPE